MEFRNIQMKINDTNMALNKYLLFKSKLGNKVDDMTSYKTTPV